VRCGLEEQTVQALPELWGRDEARFELRIREKDTRGIAFGEKVAEGIRQSMEHALQQHLAAVLDGAEPLHTPPASACACKFLCQPSTPLELSFSRKSNWRY